MLSISLIDNIQALLLILIKLVIVLADIREKSKCIYDKKPLDK